VRTLAAFAPGPEVPDAAVQVFSDALVPCCEDQRGGQDHAGWNGRAFEVGHLAAAAACGERFSGNVEALEAAHAAAHEVDEGRGVPAAVQPCGITHSL
jgi:hypothetical protein